MKDSFMASDGSAWVSISSWQLRQPSSGNELGPDDLYARFVRDVRDRIEPNLQDKGNLSSWAVRTGDDVLTYISVYASQEAMEEFWTWARGQDDLRLSFGEYVTLIRHESSSLTDMFHLGDRWQFPDIPLKAT
jgi:hypothetical protein